MSLHKRGRMIHNNVHINEPKGRLRLGHPLTLSNHIIVARFVHPHQIRNGITVQIVTDHLI